MTKARVNADNASADIQGVTAGTGLTGGGTSGTVTLNLDTTAVIQPTIFDAKADLLTATADNTPARLAVGNNGETLVADSSATTGLRWSAAPTMGNPIINSGMDIWQRGTTNSSSGSQFVADRWNTYRGAYAAGMTVSRQNTGDTTNLPQIQYCLRLQRDSGNTGLTELASNYNFENVDSTQFIGKTVTLSWYARRGANFSGSGNFFNFALVSGTGTDQAGRNGFTGQVTVTGGSAILTTTWQRYTATGTISTSAKQLAIAIQYTPTGTAGADDYMEFTGVQLDVGSVALPYRRYSATLAGEFAAACRYYRTAIVAGGASGAAFEPTFNGVPFDVYMRTAPTMGTTGVSYTGGISLVVADSLNTDGLVIYGNTTGIGTYRGRITLNAEL